MENNEAYKRAKKRVEARIEYEPGLLVEHPNRPEWGPGKVVHVAMPDVHVIFRDLPDRVAKIIRVDVVELTKAASQN